MFGFWMEENQSPFFISKLHYHRLRYFRPKIMPEIFELMSFSCHRNLSQNRLRLAVARTRKKNRVVYRVSCSCQAHYVCKPCCIFDIYFWNQIHSKTGKKSMKQKFWNAGGFRCWHHPRWADRTIPYSVEICIPTVISCYFIKHVDGSLCARIQ